MPTFSTWKKSLSYADGKPVFSGTKVSVVEVGDIINQGRVGEVMKRYPKLAQQHLIYAAMFASELDKLIQCHTLNKSLLMFSKNLKC